MNLPNELKSELAQLAAENTSLRAAAQQVLTGKDCPFCDALRFRTLDQKHWPECGTLALQDAITPSTPGLGAAMVRVVEDAKYWESKARYTADDFDQQKAEDKLLDSVQALNELEAKRE